MQKEEFYQLLENPGLLNEDTLPGLQQLTETYPFFQTAWMLYLKNLQVTGHSAFESVLKKVAVSIPDRRKLHRFLYSSAGVTAEYYFDQAGMPSSEPEGAGEGDEGEPTSLIDRFLSTKPTPIKVRKDLQGELPEESDNEIVTKSVSEPDELVTETLAMLYFEQKKYDKALDAFKKLSLKYPGKSVYFATRIEEIEKLKNI